MGTRITQVATIFDLLDINLKYKHFVPACVCVPLGGAGVEGGACPIHGRVVLTY